MEKKKKKKTWISIIISTTKLVFPIWQSPNKLIFKGTKSESESYPLQVEEDSSNPMPAASINASCGRNELRRDNLRYRPGAFPMEQTRILSQMNRKNCRITETLWSMLHRTLMWTTFLQIWFMLISSCFVNKHGHEHSSSR
jgi:hypothetical protein